MFSAFLAIGLLGAASGPSVELAQQQADDFDYAGALKTLDQVFAREGNDRATTLAVFELQGIVWGNLKQPAKARAAFLNLLTLDPTRALSGDHPPRVRTPFYEAKDQVERQGALQLTKEPPAIEADQVVRVNARLGRDPLKLVKAVRIHVRVGENEKATSVVPDARGALSVPTVAGEVRWWAEALGERDAVLLLLGSAADPVIDRGVALPLPAEKKVDGAAGVAVAPPAPAGNLLRPTGIAVAIAGIAAAGVGTYFGVTASAARSSIVNPTRDGTGAITSLTQVQAAAADRRAQDSAVIANALFGVGGGLAALGVVLFVVGGPATVTVSPAGPGVSVHGAF